MKNGESLRYSFKLIYLLYRAQLHQIDLRDGLCLRSPNPILAQDAAPVSSIFPTHHNDRGLFGLFLRESGPRYAEDVLGCQLVYTIAHLRYGYLSVVEKDLKRRVE